MDIQVLLTIIISIVLLASILELLRRKKIKEKHAIWWLGASILALILAFFPEVLFSISSFLGFQITTNFVFFCSVIILIIVALQHSAEISKIENNQQKLVEKIALLETKLQK